MSKKEFKEALKEFCLSHGFQISGTCWNEGIYGEISIKKIGEETNDYLDWEENCFNFAFYNEEE